MDVGCYCVSGCRALAGAEPELFLTHTLEAWSGAGAIADDAVAADRRAFADPATIHAV